MENKENGVSAKVQNNPKKLAKKPKVTSVEPLEENHSKSQLTSDSVEKKEKETFYLLKLNEINYNNLKTIIRAYQNCVINDIPSSDDENTMLGRDKIVMFTSRMLEKIKQAEIIKE